MNPDDIVKAVPGLAKAGAAVGAAIPFTSVVKRMLGPAADEVAEMLRDQVRLYRFGIQLACVKKAEKMAEEAGFQPNAVPPKILFPLLEGASFEEDEEMHTMWAALLVNASHPRFAERIRPAFIAILKQMSSDEARLLDWFYTEIRIRNEFPGQSIELQFNELSAAYKALQDERPLGYEFVICLSNLQASDLIGRLEHRVNNQTLPRYVPSARGIAFHRACCPPKSE